MTSLECKQKMKNLLSSQLIIPIFALLILVIFNLIRDPSFFSIGIKTNTDGNPVLAGNLISILNNASELVILAIGMTFVTSATKGQDISVGASSTIAACVLLRVIRGGAITPGSIMLGLLAAIIVAVLFCLFNGILISVFNIQPMIASLILFTAGRPIADWITVGGNKTVDQRFLSGLGGFLPGCPIPSPILIVIAFVVVVILLLKFTTLGLFVQSVGINEKAAKLNGINPLIIKLLVFVILGICVSFAGSISFSRIGSINPETLLIDIEMDAILAVAIGGNSLGGGKFNLGGSILGAYIIQALTTTLYAMKVPSTDVKAYKAIVILILVISGSPVVKESISKLVKKAGSKKAVKVEAK